MVSLTTYAPIANKIREVVAQSVQLPTIESKWQGYEIIHNFYPRNLPRPPLMPGLSISDIQFWNNRKSMEGLSVRSVFFNVFQSLIVLLYVLDNETNTVIKISCIVGLGIEIWKIGKVVDVSVDHDRQFFGIFPRIVFTDKGSYAESGTKEFDRMAFKYLGILLFPLGIGYIIYSVIYNEHKGWYSFILSSSYGFLLTFGKSGKWMVPVNTT